LENQTNTNQRDIDQDDQITEEPHPSVQPSMHFEKKYLDDNVNSSNGENNEQDKDGQTTQRKLIEMIKNLPNLTSHIKFKYFVQNYESQSHRNNPKKRNHFSKTEDDQSENILKEPIPPQDNQDDSNPEQSTQLQQNLTGKQPTRRQRNSKKKSLLEKRNHNKFLNLEGHDEQQQHQMSDNEQENEEEEEEEEEHQMDDNEQENEEEESQMTDNEQENEEEESQMTDNEQENEEEESQMTDNEQENDDEEEEEHQMSDNEQENDHQQQQHPQMDNNEQENELLEILKCLFMENKERFTRFNFGDKLKIFIQFIMKKLIKENEQKDKEVVQKKKKRNKKMIQKNQKKDMKISVPNFQTNTDTYFKEIKKTKLKRNEEYLKKGLKRYIKRIFADQKIKDKIKLLPGSRYFQQGDKNCGLMLYIFRNGLKNKTILHDIFMDVIDGRINETNMGCITEKKGWRHRNKNNKFKSVTISKIFKYFIKCDEFVKKDLFNYFKNDFKQSMQDDIHKKLKTQIGRWSPLLEQEYKNMEELVTTLQYEWTKPNTKSNPKPKFPFTQSQINFTIKRVINDISDKKNTNEGSYDTIRKNHYSFRRPNQLESLFPDFRLRASIWRWLNN
jgi:hypothetical protein